ncbi:MAG: nucleotide exchange factor GrpE [Candidatus Staskawiczbacteria bacterium]|nr:nucleotide exchange factor GrpE [Candidatus Staskawiczbacteria bacterium]
MEKDTKKEEEYLNGWKRERADFLNYKKDEMERIGQLVKYSNEELILNIMPILDNFYLAEKHLPENKEFASGFTQIKKQLEDFLKKEGIEPIKTFGEKFDPNLMEVVEEIETKEKESGVVIEETQKGYTLHGKMIRVAKVRVTK